MKFPETREEKLAALSAIGRKLMRQAAAKSLSEVRGFTYKDFLTLAFLGVEVSMRDDREVSAVLYDTVGVYERIRRQQPRKSAV